MSVPVFISAFAGNTSVCTMNYGLTRIDGINASVSDGQSRRRQMFNGREKSQVAQLAHRTADRQPVRPKAPWTNGAEMNCSVRVFATACLSRLSLAHTEKKNTFCLTFAVSWQAYLEHPRAGTGRLGHCHERDREVVRGNECLGPAMVSGGKVRRYEARSGARLKVRARGKRASHHCASMSKGSDFSLTDLSLE